MSINDILDSLITSATADKTTLDALIAQLQHTTLTSSDDELYDAPTLDDETGIWTLAQSTVNVDGLYVGCYKLPVSNMDSYISSVTIVSYTAPSAPTAPATVTPATGSPIDLTNIAQLEGSSFNAFCIRSTTSFEIEVTLAEEWCHEFNFANDANGWSSFDVGATAPSIGSPYWKTVNGYGGKVAYIEYVSQTSMTITQVTMNFNFDSGALNPNGFIRYGAIDYGFIGNSPQTAVSPDGVSGTTIQVAIGNGGGQSEGYITSMIIRGIGANPFNSINCS